MTVSLEMDPFSMQELFQRDLRAQLKPVLTVLEAPQKAFTEYATSLCQTLCQFTRAMKAPALLMEYTGLVKLLEGLESLSKAWLASSSLQSPSERFTHFHRIVIELASVFKKMVEVPPSLFLRLLQENAGMMESCLHAFQGLPDFEQGSPEEHEEQKSKASIAVTSSSQADSTIIQLFFVDLETYTRLLQEGLLTLELDPLDEQNLASLMRAVHSIKGAARVIGLEKIVHLTHTVEECLLHVKEKRIQVTPRLMECLFGALDLLQELLKKRPESIDQWLSERHSHIMQLTQDLNCLILVLVESSSSEEIKSDFYHDQQVLDVVAPVSSVGARILHVVDAKEGRQDTVRMTTAYLNRLMGYAGELLVESRSLQPFSNQLLKLKKNLYQQSLLIDDLRATYDETRLGEEGEKTLIQLQGQMKECRDNLVKQLEELGEFMRKHESLSDCLYQEVVGSRMCPFDEGVAQLPRMVRDLSHHLGKQVRLEIIGRSVMVDRDILDKLQISLQHLLRNAIDHGMETPEERVALGKPAVGTIRLEAYHRGGMLNIVVGDDGRGVDLCAVKRVIVEKKWIDPHLVEQLKKDELLAFLFFPGFSTSEQTTEISGRGFGVNTVQTMVHDVGGQIRVDSTQGQGTHFALQLPLTLSLLRSLIANIAGEPYAFPLARSARAELIDVKTIQHIENRSYVLVNDQNVRLIWGHQVLDMPPVQVSEVSLPIVILTQHMHAYGIIVDSLIGEKELIVQDLDPYLGKIPTISCGALLEDGSPVLVIDVEEIIAAADLLFFSQTETLSVELKNNSTHKRILVVDDSMTVREIESRILEAAGYVVDVADNGVDAWNLVRIQHYDLVITDIDMPGMNGLQLLQALKSSPQFKDVLVMIVSYKESPEDLKKGFKAGADRYITKSSFHAPSFLEKVHELLAGSPV